MCFYVYITLSDYTICTCTGTCWVTIFLNSFIITIELELWMIIGIRIYNIQQYMCRRIRD